MAKAHKFVGGSRMGDTRGNVPASSRSQFTGETARGKTLSTSTSRETAPGRPAATAQGCSTHNDISAFLKTAKSRGPYNGPSFASFNHFEHVSKGNNPSKFDLPSGK
jgi:hypothetical protein